MRSKLATVALVFCVIGCSLASTQAAKRDFSKMESFLGVPKVCFEEILTFNFQKDCISLVHVELLGN
jgi:hypothetical protein